MRESGWVHLLAPSSTRCPPCCDTAGVGWSTGLTPQDMGQGLSMASTVNYFLLQQLALFKRVLLMLGYRVLRGRFGLKPQQKYKSHRWFQTRKS